MNVIENFCKYLSDYSNWDYGFNLSINDHCYFYLSNHMYRIHVDIDKSRGNKGYVTPEPEKYYEWIGVFEHELSAFKSGHNFNTVTLMNAQWLKISLYYGDHVVHEELGMRLNNGKADIAYPSYSNGNWRFIDSLDIKGLPYYISVFLGKGLPTIDRNGVLPRNVVMPQNL